MSEDDAFRHDLENCSDLSPEQKIVALKYHDDDDVDTMTPEVAEYLLLNLSNPVNRELLINLYIIPKGRPGLFRYIKNENLELVWPDCLADAFADDSLDEWRLDMLQTLACELPEKQIDELYVLMVARGLKSISETGNKRFWKLIEKSSAKPELALEVKKIRAVLDIIGLDKEKPKKEVRMLIASFREHVYTYDNYDSKSTFVAIASQEPEKGCYEELRAELLGCKFVSLVVITSDGKVLTIGPHGETLLL